MAATTSATASATASVTTSASPLVALEGVTVRFGRTQALQGVDLEIEAGGFVAVIGADGAGKSTLLRTLAGVGRVSAGSVRSRVGREQLGFSGARFDLYEDLTVKENLRFFASVRDMRNAEFQHAAAEILDMVGLTEAVDRLAGHLSGGMKKKLSLAVTLICRPALLLLDEPTIGVDPASRREVWRIVANAHASGTTVVFTTTHLDEAERARRVVLLTDGEATELPSEWMCSYAQGWGAWSVVRDVNRNHLRVALARAGVDARAYTRQEGLTVLGRDYAEAEELAGRVLSLLPTGSREEVGSPRPVLEPVPLILDDIFVLLQMGLMEGKRGGS